MSLILWVAHQRLQSPPPTHTRARTHRGKTKQNNNTKRHNISTGWRVKVKDDGIWTFKTFCNSQLRERLFLKRPVSQNSCAGAQHQADAINTIKNHYWLTITKWLNTIEKKTAVKAVGEEINHISIPSLVLKRGKILCWGFKKSQWWQMFGRYLTYKNKVAEYPQSPTRSKQLRQANNNYIL